MKKVNRLPRWTSQGLNRKREQWNLLKRRWWKKEEEYKKIKSAHFRIWTIIKNSSDEQDGGEKSGMRNVLPSHLSSDQIHKEVLLIHDSLLRLAKKSAHNRHKSNLSLSFSLSLSLSFSLWICFGKTQETLEDTFKQEGSRRESE